ncbi:MAG: diguanylate cyclase [Anaerolineales bacterium]
MMKTHVSERSLSALVLYVKFASIAAVVIGVAVLLGWTFNIAVLKSLLPGLANMRPLTALGILLAGCALWLLQQEYPLLWQQRLRLIFGGLVAVIGGITLLEYIFNLDVGIDLWFFRQAVLAEGGLRPGRPSPTASFALFLLGLALLNIYRKPNWIQPLLTLPIMLIGLLALVGYAYGVSSLFTVGPYSPMALHAAFLLIILTLGVLSARPEHPVVAVLTSNLAGGVMARRLVFAALLIPFIFGWLLLQGELLGWYDGRFGLALFATFNILAFVGLIYWNAHLLNQADLQRENIFDSLRESEARYHGVLDDMLEGCQIVDFDWRYVYINNAAAIQGHTTPDKLLNHTMMEIYPGIENTDLFAILQHCMENRTIHHMVNEFTFPDGGNGWFELSIQPVLQGIFILSFDITERKQAEEKVNQLHATLEKRVAERTAELEKEVAVRAQAEGSLIGERDLLQALMDNIPDTIYFKDPASRFTRINRAQAKVLGVGDPQEAIGMADSDFQRNELADEFYQEEQKIFESGEAVINREEYNPTADGKPRWFSATKMPLKNKDGKVTGMVGISRDITERKRMEGALQSSNEQLRSSIAEAERRNREILLLSEVTNLLESSETTQEAYEILQRYLPRLFPAEAGSLFIISASRKLLETCVQWGEFEVASEKTFQLPDCWALRRGRGHIVRSIQNEMLCTHITNKSRASRAPYMCIPLMAHGEAMGVFHLQCDPNDANGITPAKEILTNAAAEQFSLSFANINLRETLRSQSIRDPLTGMFNRRYMEESLEREINRAERNRNNLGVVMLDLDHFKKFNDTFGHAAGDVALRDFGKLILNRLRGSDIACRYGGEEFALILTEVDPKKILVRLEVLREEIKHMIIEFHGNALGSFTVSGGVAFFPEHGKSSEGLFKAADDALYQAKNLGRDRIIVSTSSQV